MKIFVSPCVVNHSKVADSLLGVAIESLLGEGCDRTIIREGYKKPYLKSGAVQFNVSHCSLYVSCAVSSRAEVGIDVETISSRLLKVKNKLMDINEQASLTEHELLLKLTLRWTQYESYFKLTGEGIGRFFSALPSIEKEKEGEYWLVDNGKKTYIYSYNLGDAVLSVARNENKEPKIIDNEQVKLRGL